MESRDHPSNAEMTGTISIETFGAASKSEHTAAFLAMDRTRVRLLLGKPFETARLLGHLEGRLVRLAGRMVGHDTLRMHGMPVLLEH